MSGSCRAAQLCVCLYLANAVAIVNSRGRGRHERSRDRSTDSPRVRIGPEVGRAQSTADLSGEIDQDHRQDSL
jgi:hypothetical protein